VLTEESSGQSQIQHKYKETTRNYGNSNAK